MEKFMSRVSQACSAQRFMNDKGRRAHDLCLHLAKTEVMSEDSAYISDNWFLSVLKRELRISPTPSDFNIVHAHPCRRVLIHEGYSVLIRAHFWQVSQAPLTPPLLMQSVQIPALPSQEASAASPPLSSVFLSPVTGLFSAACHPREQP